MRKHFGLTVLIGLACLAILTAVSSRSADAKAGYQPIVDTFFRKIQDGKPEEAITYFFSQHAWMARMPLEVEKLKSQVGAMAKTLGEYHGHELLVEKVVVGRLAVVRYFAIYDRQPVRFTFNFYKPKEAWVPLSIFIDDNLAQELSAATNLETILKGR